MFVEFCSVWFNLVNFGSVCVSWILFFFFFFFPVLCFFFFFYSVLFFLVLSISVSFGLCSIQFY